MAAKNLSPKSGGSVNNLKYLLKNYSVFPHFKRGKTGIMFLKVPTSMKEMKKAQTDKLT